MLKNMKRAMFLSSMCHFPAHQCVFCHEGRTCFMSVHLFFDAVSWPDCSTSEHCKIKHFFFFFFPRLVSKNILPKSSVSGYWQALTGAGTAVTSTEYSLSSISFLEIFNMFWQLSQSGSQGFFPRYRDQMTKNIYIFMKWRYAPAHHCLQL